jgi:hypothetical protein
MVVMRISLLLSIVAMSSCGARTELASPEDPCASSPRAPTAFPSVACDPKTCVARAGGVLAITNDAAYFSTGISVGPSPRTTLMRASLVGGVPEPFVPDASVSSSGLLAHDASYLYFPDVVDLDSSDIPHQSLVAASLHGGPSITLANPNGETAGLVWDVQTNGEAGVFWLFAGSVFWLAHWDGSSTTALASLNDLPYGLAVSATRAFVLTLKALYAVPLSGGAAVELRGDLPGTDTAPPSFLGLNEQALFYTPDLTSIVRRELASGTETIIASNIHTVAPGGLESGPGAGGVGGIGRSGWVDASWVYFLTGPQYPIVEPETLSRVSIDGGEVEVISAATEHPPSGGVATDACNVYWLAASGPWDPAHLDSTNGPSLLMYRRK